VIMPSDVVFEPDQAVIRFLLREGYFNPFPDNRFEPQRPISRAEFVTLLYRAAGLSTPYVSEFAYFRDVPTNHWAYIAVEGLRVRSVVAGDTQGFFRPEDPITRLEAAIEISKSLPEDWLKLSSTEIETTLKAYADVAGANIPTEVREDLARSIYAGLLELHTGIAAPGAPTKFTLDLDIPLTRMETAHMVYQRSLIAHEQVHVHVHDIDRLPPGIHMTLSPTSALAVEQLSVGETMFFTVTEDVPVPGLNTVIPRGARASGKITELTAADPPTAIVALDRIRLPSGDVYDMKSQVILIFPTGKDEKRFIVPGQTFPIVTSPPQ
jgi:hypothetical protein